MRRGLIVTGPRSPMTMTSPPLFTASYMEWISITYQITRQIYIGQHFKDHVRTLSAVHLFHLLHVIGITTIHYKIDTYLLQYLLGTIGTAGGNELHVLALRLHLAHTDQDLKKTASNSAASSMDKHTATSNGTRRLQSTKRYLDRLCKLERREVSRSDAGAFLEVEFSRKPVQLVWSEDSVCSIGSRDRPTWKDAIPFFELCNIASNKEHFTAAIQSRSIRTLSGLRMPTLTNIRVHRIYSSSMNAYQDLSLWYDKRKILHLTRWWGVAVATGYGCSQVHRAL